MKVLGSRVLRREDPGLLTGAREYVEDIRIPGSGFVTYVRSGMAHARILSIDTTEAETAPGVLAVVTARDLDLAPANPMAMGGPPLRSDMLRPWLADGVVRFVGEPIVAIVTDERAQGADAADMVVIDYEPLPVLVDPHQAARDETLLFPQARTNVVATSGSASADFFDGCDVVVKLRNRAQRLAPSPIEVRGSVAQWDDDGRLTFWTATQTPHAVRDVLAQSLGLDPSQVRVITPAVGGGFGAKGEWHHDQLLIAWLSRHVGRPLRWTETRSESMTAMVHGRGQWQEIEIGGGRDGVVAAYRLSILQDAGAYPGLGAALAHGTARMASGPYRFSRIETVVQSVVTNTTPIGAYRGASRPEATDAVERAMDVYAAEIGIDPAELRRRNLIPPDAFPFTTATGQTYDSGDYQAALDLVLDTIGYDDLRAEQTRRRVSGDTTLLGIGISTYVEAAGFPVAEFGALEIHPDGTAVAHTGTASHGQGHATTWAMIISEQTGIAVADIEVIHGDTGRVPHGIGTFGSRSAQSGGGACREAADAVVDRARDLAANLLEAHPDDVVLDVARGAFHVAGIPSIVKTWADLASAAPVDDPLRAETMHTSPTTNPFGADLAVVEIDIETGAVTLERIVAVDDAGRILNPLLAEGQVHGGLAQGIAAALYEEVRYDDDGNPLTSTFADYSIISASELPMFETIFTETPSPLNALGVKGIGESGTIGATAAVHNAAIDAVAHLGIRHLDMPLTPARVWKAVDEATSRGGDRAIKERT